MSDDALNEFCDWLESEADDLRGMEIIVKDLSDQLKQAQLTITELQTKVDELTKERLQITELAKIDDVTIRQLRADKKELTMVIERFTHCPDCGVDGSEHDPSCRAFEESE